MHDPFSYVLVRLYYIEKPLYISSPIDDTVSSVTFDSPEMNKNAIPGKIPKIHLPKGKVTHASNPLIVMAVMFPSWLEKRLKLKGEESEEG